MRYVISLSAAFDGTFSSSVFKWACSCCEQLAVNTHRSCRVLPLRALHLSVLFRSSQGDVGSSSHIRSHGRV